jgi:ParB family chromosome partitioning protein
MTDIITIPLNDDIVILDRHRAVDQDKVDMLVESMREVGQLNPILVHREEDGSGPVILVAGRHRLEAARQLGWSGIDAIFVEADELHRELIEIDENLCRSELSPAEFALAISRRKAIYEALHPETAHGGDRKSEKSTRQNGDLNADRFSKDTADRTGKSERTIQRNAERTRKIGEDNLAKIRGTSLDSAGELDALAKLDPETIDDLCYRAACGKVVSAKAAQPEPTPEPEPADRWRELSLDEAAAEEEKERAEAEAEAKAKAEADADADADADDDDDELEGTKQLVDNSQLHSLLKQLDALVFDSSFNEPGSWGWWHHPGIRKIEGCDVELYELLGKLKDGLHSLHSIAENGGLVGAYLDAKARAKEERKKAAAAADLELAKAEYPKLRQRAEALGLSLKRREANFYLKRPGSSLAVANTLREVVAKLERHEAAAKAKVAA